MTTFSALMLIGHILFCYILFFCFNKPFGYGATVVEKNKSHSPQSFCSSSEKGLRGPCSRFGQMNSAATSSRNLAQVMYSRSYNRGKTNWQGGGATDPGIPSDSVGEGTVRVGFGTPAKYFNLVVDTGSYITWVRCPQQQNGSLYNPSDSSTSSNAPCSPDCEHSQSYADGSKVDGVFVVDTLFMDHDVEIPQFKFLCVDGESGNVDETDGILGLGLAVRGNTKDFLSYSFAYQTLPMFQNLFCYCLPASANAGKANVYFGEEEAYRNCPSGYSTRLQSNPSGDSNTASKYFVTLNAITIGTTTVEMSPGLFSSRNTIMDSGTLITRLPSSAYFELSSEFTLLMLASGFQPTLVPDNPDNVLDTCYNLEGSDYSEIPNMVLHFDDLDIPLDHTAVTWKGNGMSQVCLAFAAKMKDDDFTIIGSHQLQSRNILYNIPEQRLEIGPSGSC